MLGHWIGRHWHSHFVEHYDSMMDGIEELTFRPKRRKLLSRVSGFVLEIGSGTGANLSYYPVESSVTLSEPDPLMWNAFRRKWNGVGRRMHLTMAHVENIPFPDETFDNVVSTLVLCSVQDVRMSLKEIRRVLKPAGSLLFIEHFRGEGVLGLVQDCIRPLWSRMGRGCHPNRRTVESMVDAGLLPVSLEVFDPFLGMALPVRLLGRLVSPFVCGVASKAAGTE